MGSTPLDSVPGSAVEIVRDDPVQRIRELKAEPGKNIWLVGGGALASSFDTEARTTTEVRAFPSGMTLLCCSRSGDGV
ncbi:MAG: hypothetical protein L0K67_02525 [Brevibacterium sp.]|nr:hypothetical protein [Brevibacterium sp.]